MGMEGQKKKNEFRKTKVKMTGKEKDLLVNWVFKDNSEDWKNYNDIWNLFSMKLSLINVDCASKQIWAELKRQRKLTRERDRRRKWVGCRDIW